MFASKFWKQPCRILGTAAAVMLLSADLTLSAPQKPSGGGTGGGTIYFENSPTFTTMNSDGSGKTPLPILGGEPSYALHGGRRWFLGTREIIGATYPNGTTRHELFAYSDDGAANVQLTNQPDLQADSGGGTTRWTRTDGVVSWIARRWDPVTGMVVNGGIYAAGVSFDANGVPGLVEQPLYPLVPLALVLSDNGSYFSGGLAPDISSHDWAPDGLYIVHDRLNRAELWVADAALGVTGRILATNHADVPVWSPDGTRIAFGSSAGIDTIAPNGGSRNTIIKWAPTYTVFSPRWSPTGSHLTYVWWDRHVLPWGGWDIYRVTANGGGKTNLTKDIGNTPVVIGWR